jgi:hypothetical protein
MAAIRRPGVEITQEFVTESPTIFSPDLMPVIMGPCFQIVDAFDDDGVPQSEALAGTYEDGSGLIAYDLPGLKTGADLSTTSDGIRVFMLLGSDSTELNNEDNEVTIASGTSSGAFSGSAFTDGGATWVADGVEKDDVVRITYAGISYDLVISADATLEGSVSIASDPIGETLAAETYTIIRKPAQFVYKATAEQAEAVIIADEDNYLTLTGLSTSTLYAGSAGDTLTFKVSETTKYISASTLAVSGSTLTDLTEDFITDFKTVVGPANIGNYSVLIGSTAYPILTCPDADTITVTGAPGDDTGVTYAIVKTTSVLALSHDADLKQIEAVLARTAGISSNTYVEMLAAFNTPADASYDATVALHVIASNLDTSGTSVIDSGDVGSHIFDGGVDADQLLVDADLVSFISGGSSASATGKLYVSYKALRVDVSPAATSPALLEYETSTEAKTAIGPFVTANPLGLGVYFALLNSPSKKVSAIGVSAVSASQPDGTTAAWAEVLEFLGGKDVYFLVPLTQDVTVHQAAQTHVDSMSSAANKAERICFFNTAFPAYASAATIASGTEADTATMVSNATGQFTTNVNLSDSGVDNTHFLVVTARSGSDDSPTAVNGTQGPLYGIAIDSLAADDPFTAVIDDTDGDLGTDWNDMVAVSWTIYDPGAAITTPAAQSTEVAAIGEGYANRRMFHHWPDTVTAVVDGTSSNIAGYYAACAWAGKAGENDPQAPFTNTGIAGFTGLKNSNGYFTESQLDTIAGGGTFISIQESQSAPLKCRHQLATDVSSVQKRELSITKTIDYVAKTLRATLKGKIGVFNITQAFLDSLSASIQGLLMSMIESGVIKDGRLTSIEVDASAPDTVNVTILLSVFSPANYVLLTLQV